MPHACTKHSASVLNGLIYIVGAGIGHQGVFRFDPASDAWSTLAPTIYDRLYGASFVLAGSLFAAGGDNADASASVERYDVVTNTWTDVADMLEGRSNFCAVTIGSASPAEEENLFDTLIAKAFSRQSHQIISKT